MVYKKKKDYFPYFLLIPCFIFIFFFMIYSTLYSLFLSVTDVTGYSYGGFVGLKNFFEVLFYEPFTISIQITLYFVIFCLIVELLLGLGIAIVLDKVTRGSGLMKSLLILPMMSTPIVVGLIFRLIYEPSMGILSLFLEFIGLQKQNWLSNPGQYNTALFAVTLVDIWQFTPFVALILLGGIKSISSDFFEAASIDGASTAQIIRHITLPMMTTTFMIAIIFNLMRLFKTFDIIVMLTKGGPGYSTYLVSYGIQQVAMPHMRLSYASAMTWLLLILVLIIGNIYNIYLRRAFRG